MLTLKDIKSSTEDIINRLKIKSIDATATIEIIISLDQQRINQQIIIDGINNELNILAKEIGSLFKSGKTEEANLAKEKTTSLKELVKQEQEKMEKMELELNKALVSLPNAPHASVPFGKSEKDNIIIKTCEKELITKGELLPHWDLAKKYDIIDFELGNKLAGAGFPVYKGQGARIQRALISYFLDKNISAGYLEVMPPIVTNEDSAYGTGNLPDKEGQMYHINADNLYLIPTAEIPVTNIYRNSIVNENELPIKLTAYTPCFRREAGSYGKDVRGLNRLHQFDKVEIVQIQQPEKSYETLEEMVLHVENIIKELGLPYRILKLCGGDTSFTSAMTYDFEVYSIAQERWLEVSSVSNFESFQANRLKLRYKGLDKKNNLCHTLNGSSLALPRILAALLEFYQTEDGIVIPEVLVKYMGGIEIIK